jgi:pyruvate dehydrogenase E2 component (dihydrolipoamide acetyltransferase)
MSRIKKISGANLHRNWVMIPHVTNHDDADITDLEAFRVSTNKENEKSGIKVTMLAFLIKACVAALKKFPEFNAPSTAMHWCYKQYFHIGFAADTPNGLMVPVIKDADKKGVLQISQEMGELAKKARDGKLSPAEMSGACFTISSLGGIGGRYFTPIINAPEVAILGVCKSQMEPVWDGKPFSRLIRAAPDAAAVLSWDHRVIDVAAAAIAASRLPQLHVGHGDFARTRFLHLHQAALADNDPTSARPASRAVQLPRSRGIQGILGHMAQLYAGLHALYAKAKTCAQDASKSRCPDIGDFQGRGGDRVLVKPATPSRPSRA